MRIHVLALLVVSCFSLGHAKNINSADELVDLFRLSAGNVNEELFIQKDLDFASSNLQAPLGGTSSYCRSFVNTIHGQGHKIKNFVLKNSIHFNSAIFCKLEDAMVENLVIDSTCYFNGTHSGSLSVAVDGDVTVNNVTNKATVIGFNSAGGLIGRTSESTESTLKINDCTNEGHITSMGQYSGGFIGWIHNDIKGEVLISNSFNNGNVSGKNLCWWFYWRIR